MSPTAAMEAAYAGHIAGALLIPVLTGLSAEDLPQEKSFVVVSCDECQHLGAGFYRGTVVVTLRTHALDQSAQVHSGYWQQVSEALQTVPAPVRGHFRNEQANDREDHYWLTRETLTVGLAAN
ncbi:MAG: hypothetical protein FGM15_05290 [Chthoniobacterales bacterium]|nr:hypothetical protein [Chthoniobacterales bacterium]